MPAALDDLARYHAALRHLGEYRPAGNGVTFRCPLRTRHKNGDANPSCRAFVGRDGNLVLLCRGCGARWQELTAALGIDPRDCSTRSRGYRMDGPKPQLVATYRYQYADRSLAYEKQRYEPGRDGRRKDFVARRPLPAEWRKRLSCPAGQEAWVYGLAGDEYGRPPKVPPVWNFRRPIHDTWTEVITVTAAEPVLYRLPELLAADPRHPVFVVEAEGDVELLRSLGFVATCGHAGANTWLPEWAGLFRGRRVVVIPDHNVVGYQHAGAVAGSVMRAGCASVRVLAWSDEPDDPHRAELGWGVKNWLESADCVGKPDQWKAAVVGFVKGAVEYTGTPVHH